MMEGEHVLFEQENRVNFVNFPIESCHVHVITRHGYMPIDIIGIGKTGKVVLCRRRLSSGTQVLRAVKAFRKESRHDWETEGLFMNQVGIMKTLQHRHIMSHVKAFEGPNEYLLSMPFYRNGSLRHNLPTLTKELTDRYLWQLTDAVLYLHTLHHLAHRDIKPDNILIARGGNIILSDFGYACVVKSRSIYGYWPEGTRDYMPPELLRPRRSDINLFKCDMFSVGVVLWNMAFRVVRAPDCLDYLGFLPYNPDIPAFYRHLLEHLLHKDSTLRWDCRTLMDTLISAESKSIQHA